MVNAQLKLVTVFLKIGAMNRDAADDERGR